MPTVFVASAHSPSARVSAVLKGFADEAATLAKALLNPGESVREVERMRALHVQAERLQATDPARAAVLRQRAAAMGLS